MTLLSLQQNLNCFHSRVSAVFMFITVKMLWHHLHCLKCYKNIKYKADLTFTLSIPQKRSLKWKKSYLDYSIFFKMCFFSFSVCVSFSLVIVLLWIMRCHSNNFYKSCIVYCITVKTTQTNDQNLKELNSLPQQNNMQWLKQSMLQCPGNAWTHNMRTCGISWIIHYSQ